MLAGINQNTRITPPPKANPSRLPAVGTVGAGLMRDSGYVMQERWRPISESVGRETTKRGTKRKNELHGGTHSNEHGIWRGIIQRCYNPNAKYYDQWGGRGIRMCDRWLKSFSAFLSDVGPRPSMKHSIDRFPNNDGNYEPGNVRWATRLEQQSNTKKNVFFTHNGETLHLREWARRSGVNHRVIHKRIKAGMTGDDVLRKAIKRPEEMYGIYFVKRVGNWQARLHGIHLGIFDIKENAMLAMRRAKNGTPCS